jgi:hypothetical protein
MRRSNGQQLSAGAKGQNEAEKLLPDGFSGEAPGVLGGRVAAPCGAIFQLSVGLENGNVSQPENW